MLWSSEKFCKTVSSSLSFQNGRLTKWACGFFGSIIGTVYVSLKQKIYLTYEAACAH